jgi:hypothetical protein
MLRHCFRFAATVLLVSVGPQSAWAEPQTAQDLSREYGKLGQQFTVGVWRPAAPATGTVVFIAPDQFTLTAQESGHSFDRRKQYADRLFELAERAAEMGQLSLAFQWANETLYANPDHANGRRVLGYVRYGGRWLTPYGGRMAAAGKSWHPKFGWIASADVARYDAGERFVDGRWISAEAHTARHSSLKNGWQIRTDHFLITTNHSLETAAELAARLERLHQVWRQLFAGFYLSENEIRRLFAGQREPRRQVRPFRVYYHRTKDEYIDALRSRQPRIAETLGIYFDTHREAHFFAGSDPDAGTLYHEAVHQLFQESRPAASHIGEGANFWIVEGVATYFETLREHASLDSGPYFTVGESTAGRLPAARDRLTSGFYVPLAELTQLGKQEVQQHPEIAKLYSQSAGMTAFLMHAAGGRFREPLVQYLKAVYEGRDRQDSLADAVGESYQEIDAKYRRYMESLP